MKVYILIGFDEGIGELKVYASMGAARTEAARLQQQQKERWVGIDSSSSPNDDLGHFLEFSVQEQEVIGD